MCEVLGHESTQALLDRQGKRARFEKRQKVIYLQNSIIAYQDQGWSDGKSLLDYQRSPGVVVDQYRPGQLFLTELCDLLGVDQESKRQGVGRVLVDNLVTAARDLGCSQIVLKCPTDLGANEFYEQFGFTLAETLNGRLRPLNVWIMPLILRST